ncbi:MAG: hypothetical protein E7032_04715 [Akkermansiaceae bacterium]|nr:hypothetical protein [Akkermansiaceae bacterium]
MNHALIAFALLLAGTACADWKYQREVSPLPLPEGYQAPRTGENISRFDRAARPPYWDAASGCLVFESCMPPKRRKGTSHFYTFVYKLSADGKTLTRTSRMWNSYKTDEPPTPHTYTNNSDTPYCFTEGRSTHTFSIDSKGTITRIVTHGYNPLTGKNLPPEGRVIYPTPEAPSIVHYLP